MSERPAHGLVVRNLGLSDYRTTWDAMSRFTDARSADTPDELWLLQHLPVYTQGRAGRASHVLDPGDVPVVRTDRGGQVTYHGPGQLVAYVLLDLARRSLGVRRLVWLLEESVIGLLAQAGVRGERREGAPGVYVQGRKLAAVGLRVRRGMCYHGLAVNVDLDPEPFCRIDPCGYRGLEVTRLADLGVPWSVAETGSILAAQLTRLLERAPP